MRLMQLSVPESEREAIVDVLRERDLGYTVAAGAGEDADHVIVNAILPADAVEYVLEDVEEAGLDREKYTVSIETQFAEFAGIEDVQDRWANTPNKIAPTTLRSKAKDMRLNTRSYLWMMFLATVVATIGLLQGSPAVVVGSMVIAPIVSPMLTAGVGAVQDDRDMLVDSIRMQAAGLGFAVVGAIAFGLVLRYGFAVPTSLALEDMALLSLRLSPSLLTVVVGLAAGAAGTYGLATKGRVTIVGVMIAAALIPTAAAAGIGVAWGNYLLGVGALALLLIAVIAVNLGSTGMLFYLGYSPGTDRGVFHDVERTRGLVTAATLVLTAVVVLVVGAAFLQQAAFELRVNDAATDVLEDGAYDDLGITDVSVEYAAPVLAPEPTGATFTLSRIGDREFPDLPDELDREITERTGREVTVRVQYVDYHTSGDPGAAAESIDGGPARGLAAN